jgi:Fe-S-cluster containining protein
VADTTQKTIHLPALQNFNCTSCGKCCRTDWRIKVHDLEAKTIESLEIFKKVQREGFHPLTVVEDQLQLARRDNLDCFFLEEERCLIHQEGGPSAKPAPCRLFPFQLVGTPDGYYVSMSFSCPAVISGCGEPTDHSLEDLKLTVQESPHFFPPELDTSHLVTVATDVKLPWEAYLEYESSVLNDILNADNLTDCLLRVISVVADAVTGHREPDYDLNSTPSSDILEQNLQQLLPIITNITIASLEECESLERRQEVIGGLAGGVGYQSNLLGAYAPPRSKYQALDQVTISILKRYVHGLVWGKSLITGPSLLSRLLYLATCLEVFTYYLGAKKMLNSQLHFSQVEVEWCFDLLENQARHHQDILMPVFLEWENDLLGFGRQLHESYSGSVSTTQKS